MTITYKELKRLIRFKSRDNNEIRFSDYDIREALNECIRYFNNSYALQNSDFMEKHIDYDQNEMNREVDKINAERLEAGEELLPRYDFRNEGVELPEDFISLEGVVDAHYWNDMPMFPTEGYRKPNFGEYKVSGNRIYFGSGCARVLYKAAIPEVKSEDDVLELPFVFKDSLAKITCMILENNATTDVMMEAVNDAVSSIVPRRRYSNTRVRMPFYA